MPHDDDLDTQLRAFGETLQHHAGEPIRPGATPAASMTSPRGGRRRWSVFAAAAATAAVVIGALLVVGGSDDTINSPATQPEREATTTPIVDTPPGTTAAPPTSEAGVSGGEWEPIVFSGAGSQTIELPDDPLVGRLFGAAGLSHDGSGPFQVVLVEDSEDGSVASDVVDTVGAYSGRRPWRLDQINGPVKIPRTVEVTADGNWSLELIHVVQSDRFTRLELVDGGTVSGSGDDVIAPLFAPGGSAGGALTADFECSGCAGDIDVVAVGNGVQVIADDVGDGGLVQSSAILPTSGWLLLVVETSTPDAAGEWTLSLRLR